MKKLFRLICLMLLLAVSASALAACASSVSGDKALELLSAGIENSLSSVYYYYKETTLKGGESISLNVNLWGELDKDFAPVIKDGVPENHKLSIVKTQKKGTEDVIILERYCGQTAMADGTLRGSYLLSGPSEKTAVPLDLADYLASEAFSEYSLARKLDEIKLFTAGDITVTSAKTTLKVTTIKLTVNSDYLLRYESEFGKKSVFEGADRVEIEITYDRISAITTYAKERDEVAKITVEKEPYKLYITYYGPKFTIPTLTAADKW